MQIQPYSALAEFVVTRVEEMNVLETDWIGCLIIVINLFLDWDKGIDVRRFWDS